MLALIVDARARDGLRYAHFSVLTLKSPTLTTQLPPQSKESIQACYDSPLSSDRIADVSQPAAELGIRHRVRRPLERPASLLAM